MKSFHRKLPSTRPLRKVVIPAWLRIGAEGCMQVDESIQTVLLFGSRASGHYLDESDWDVCLIHSDEIYSDSKPHLAEQWRGVDAEVEESHIHAARFAAERRVPYSFPHAVCQACRLLAGTPIREELTTSKQEPCRNVLVMHLTYAYLHLVQALTSLDAVANKPFNVTAMTASADATERAIKALCCLTGNPYERMHEVAKLAKDVPASWRDLVLSMNGDTGTHHTGVYFSEGLKESIEKTERRCGLTADLLDKAITHFEVRLSDDELETVHNRLAEIPSFMTALSGDDDKLSNALACRLRPQIRANLAACFDITTGLHRQSDTDDF